MPGVVIYKGVYQYGAVNFFADCMADAFRSLGRDVFILDLSDDDNLVANMRKAFTTDTEFILSFGAVGYAFRSGDKSLYDTLPFPFVALLVDHPCHHIMRLIMKNMLVTTIDRSHSVFLRRYFKGALKSFYLPHGGCLCPGADVDISVSARPVDLLFAGTYMDREECFNEIKRLDRIPRRLALAAIDRVLACDSLPIERALEETALEGDIDIYADSILPRITLEVIPRIELFVRAVKRMEVLSALDRAGTAVDIYGNNWPGGLFRNHRIHEALPFEKILLEMTRSKIVMNIGNYPEGSHERVFSAMLNGALMLSDYNPYFEEIFREDRNISLYRWTDIDALPDKVAGLLDDGERRETIAATGKAEAEKNHTWDNRASELLKMVHAFRKHDKTE
jgi:hypothetical protein